MKLVTALDLVFDGAVVFAVAFFVAFLWTFALVCLQATVTCGIVAFLALAALARVDRPRPPAAPQMPRRTPAQDFVSDEEFDETLLGP